MASSEQTLVSLPLDGRFARWPHAVAFSRDGSRWVVGCGDRGVLLFERGGKAPVACARARATGRPAIFDASGDPFVVSGTMVYRIEWATATRAAVAYRGHKMEAGALTLSSDGAVLYTGSGGVVIHDPWLRAFDTATGTLLWKTRPVREGVACRGVAESADGLIAAWDNGEIHVHDRGDGVSRSKARLVGASPGASCEVVSVCALDVGFVATWTEDGAPRLTRLSIEAGHLQLQETIALAKEGTRADPTGRPAFDPHRQVVVVTVKEHTLSTKLTALVVDLARGSVVDEAHLAGAGHFFEWALSSTGEIAWTRYDGVGLAKLL
jgi:hypothetical protein